MRKHVIKTKLNGCRYWQKRGIRPLRKVAILSGKGSVFGWDNNAGKIEVLR